MRVLFIGEVVGRAGIYCIKALLPELKRELGIDLTIASAEGATGGFGIGKNHAIYLHKLGVDVITTGDFTYFKRDMVGHIAQARYMVRPANYPYGNPGRGWVAVRPPAAGQAAARKAADGQRRADTDTDTASARETASSDGEIAPTTTAAGGAATTTDSATSAQDQPAGGAKLPKIGIISLLGQAGYSRVHLRNPFELVPQLVERAKQETPIVILDFHATTTAEKRTMFAYVDGKVSAVVGTHVRTLSADAEVQAGGTATITHAGRTGSLNSVGGLDPEIETRKFLSQVHEQSRDTWGLLELQGVVMEIDADGTARSIETLRRQCTAPEAEQRAAEAPPQGQRRRKGRGAAGRRGSS